MADVGGEMGEAVEDMSDDDVGVAFVDLSGVGERYDDDKTNKPRAYGDGANARNGVGQPCAASKFPHIVSLNVGGCHYMTRLSTLCKYPDSMLAAMFSGRHRLDLDAGGSYFIDSNGACFVHILDFLRHGTLPPSGAALRVYREACYYNVGPLITKLQTFPEVAKMLVWEAHRAQFPDYEGVKVKVINAAMERAAVTRTGEVFINAFRQEFKPKAPYFDVRHDCVVDGAQVTVGPWDAPPDEEILIKTLEQDFADDGFVIRPHEPRRRCKYYNGQNCQKAVYKITFVFQ